VNAAVEYSINQAHERLGRSHEDATRATAIVLGIKLKRGVMKPFRACTVAKANQNNLTKVSEYKK
jgi:hypothetical protein